MIERVGAASEPRRMSFSQLGFDRLAVAMRPRYCRDSRQGQSIE
jgi:hypothetical protein